MSVPKILIAAAVAVLSTLVYSMPMDNRRSSEDPKIMALNEVINKTVCPIKVEYDEKHGRIPRIIKMLKCATEPSHCSQSDHKSHDCCNHKNDHYHMGCVEMRDVVLVGYRTDDGKINHTTLEVSVGCSCMFEEIKTAEHPPGV